MIIRRPDNRIKNNARWLLVFLAAVVILADFGGIIRTAVINGNEHRQQAESQQMSDTVVTAPRGTVYDRNMNVLAQSASAWVLCATPKNINHEETAEKMAKYLSELFESDYDVILKKLMNKESQYAELQKQVTAVQKSNIDEFIKENKYGGVLYFTPSSMRYYPKNNFASTVLGFTNRDGEGKAGVELTYDEMLTGTPGRIITAKDANSNSMDSEYESIVDAQDGTGLILSIDSNIQHYLEKALAEGMEDYYTKGAYGIVMDVKTGGVLAMASKPDYDSNNAYTVYDEKIKTELEELKGTDEYAEAYSNALFSQWNNKTVSFVYEPGSVFKIFTLSAGLEEGVISENTSYCCVGSYNIGGWDIHCINRNGHGTQSMRQGLMNSCNPFFIYVGQKLGTERYFKYFDAFGFTEKTGIDLPGEAVPVSGTTYHAKDNFSSVNLASTSFGQTIKVSPIQIITAACSIANGGKLMKPYIVAGTVDGDGNILSTTQPVVRRQVISESTAKTVCSMMESVVSSGTGKNAYIAGYRVAGKTATSQKIQESEEQNKKIYSASFLCFAPADDPQIATLIIMDEPQGSAYGGGTVAAPVAKQVMEESLTYLNIEPSYTSSELASVISQAPKLVGSTVAAARQTAANHGYSVKVIGEGTSIVSQTPAANKSIPKGGVIVIYTDGTPTSSKVKVPDFAGMSISSANQLAVSTGINIVFSGPSVKTASMKAYKQSIQPDDEIEAGSNVTVYFKEDTGAAAND